MQRVYSNSQKYLRRGNDEKGRPTRVAVKEKREEGRKYTF